MLRNGEFKLLMEYKDQELLFQDDRIVMKEYSDQVVMMTWEDEIMKKSAEYICESKVTY